MAERGLAFDGDPGGARVRWPSRPSLVPLPPPAEPAPRATAEQAAELGACTEVLLALLVDWVSRAREQQRARRAAGLPAVDVSAENAIVDRFAARLGPDGAEIALALISRSRPGLPE